MESVQKSVHKYIQNLRDNENEIMMKPFYYMHEKHETDSLPIVAFAFNHWMQIPDDKLDKVIEIIKLMRDGATLIDDIEDGSVARDGVPVAHQVYGLPHTINSANFGYFLAIKKAQEIGDPEIQYEAIKACYEEMMNFHIGQGTEIYWRDIGYPPTEQEFKDMAITKTSCFVSLTARLMQLFSTNKSNFIDFSLLFGFYMQVKNDYCNLMCAKCSNNKFFCEDFTEGKFNFPITHAINQKNEKAKRVLDIVKQKTTDISLKKECLRIMEELGSLEYGKNSVTSLYETLCTMITELGHNEMMLKVLNGLHKCHLVL